MESYCLIVTVSIWNDEKLLEINSGDVHNVVNVINVTELYN